MGFGTFGFLAMRVTFSQSGISSARVFWVHLYGLEPSFAFVMLSGMPVTHRAAAAEMPPIQADGSIVAIPLGEEFIDLVFGFGLLKPFAP